MIVTILISMIMPHGILAQECLYMVFNVSKTFSSRDIVHDHTAVSISQVGACD